MGAIIVALPGPWDKPPALGGAIEIERRPADPDVIEEIAAIAELDGTLPPRLLRQARRHRSVLIGHTRVERRGDLEPARQILRLLGAGLEAGAPVALVATSGRLIHADMLRDLDLEDGRLLLHLLVRISGGEGWVRTEGMQGFALPDVEVAYTEGSFWAEGAAFACSAQLLLDGLAPQEGALWRASEGALTYRFGHQPPGDDERANPHGRWALLPI